LGTAVPMVVEKLTETSPEPSALVPLVPPVRDPLVLPPELESVVYVFRRKPRV